MPSRHHRRSLPPLGVRLFVLRTGVVLELDASTDEVAAAPPSTDAWAWFEADAAAAVLGARGYRGRRDPRGWLTLREASVLIGCEPDDARARLQELDMLEAEEHDPAVRRVCRWELVATAALSRYVARFGGAVSEAAFIAAINTEHVQRALELELLKPASLAPPPTASSPKATSAP